MIFILLLFLTVINILTEKIPINQIKSLFYAEISQEYEMHPCQAVCHGEKVMTYAVALGTHRVRRMF